MSFLDWFKKRTPPRKARVQVSLCLSINWDPAYLWPEGVPEDLTPEEVLDAFAHHGITREEVMAHLMERLQPRIGVKTPAGKYRSMEWLEK